MVRAFKPRNHRHVQCTIQDDSSPRRSMPAVPLRAALRTVPAAYVGDVLLPNNGNDCGASEGNRRSL